MVESHAPRAREVLRGKIMALQVFDVHNHLRGGERLAAKDFWDIGHYFWFKRELEAAGYPRTAEDLPEPERARAFIKALDRARNTAWNQAVRAAMKELFDTELVDEASISALNAKIAATHADPEWPKKVCRLAGLAALTIGSTDTAGYGSVSDIIRPAPSYNPVRRGELERVAEADDQKRAFSELVGKVRERLDEFQRAGIRAMRAPWLFEPGDGLITDVPELKPAGNTPEQLKHAMAHAFFKELDARRFHLQIFLGVEGPKPGYKPRTKAHRSRPVNDTSRIVAMHEIFDMYADCTFELINAAELSSLDIVQAARAYTNVYPGGLWWFTFRPSVYRANMQYRMEGLPACRSTFVATDARCIEWAYIKTMYVKRLMAEFLCDQVERGWLDEDSALSTAQWWLHDTGAGLYAPEGEGD
jgi:glucuronate isomerase